MATSLYGLTTGISANTPPIPTVISQKMLFTPFPVLIASTACFTDYIEKAEGKNKMYVGVENFPDLMPINDTTTAGPAPFTPSYYALTVTAQLLAISTILPVTSIISSQIKWLAVTITNQKKASLKTEDKLICQALLRSANNINCTYGTNGQIPTEPSATDLTVVRDLQIDASAPELAAGIEATPKISTTGFSGGYIMLTSTAGMSVFTTQASNIFVQYGTASRPEERLPAEIGFFATAGIRVLASPVWQLSGAKTSSGYPIIKAAIISVQSYLRLVHPELEHRTVITGSAYLGINNLQEGASTQHWMGASITQPTWVRTVSYTTYKEAV